MVDQEHGEDAPSGCLAAWGLLLAALVLSPAFWAAIHFWAWGTLWICYLAGTAPEAPPPFDFWALWRP